VAGARHAAQALEAELAGVREQLNEQHGKLAAAEGRMAFNRERRADLEGRIERNRADIEATGAKLVQQEFVFRRRARRWTRSSAGSPALRTSSPGTRAGRPRPRASASGSSARCTRAAPRPTAPRR
jgi:hypothetical protein